MEKEKSVKKMWWKWLLGSLGLILLLIGGLAIYFSARWKPLLSEKIKTGIAQGSAGLYHLDFKDIHLNLLTGTASLDEVSLVPDTAVFNRLKAQGAAPIHIFQLKVKKVQVNHLGLMNAYFKKKIHINSIVLDQPSINMLHYQLKKKKKDTSSKTIYQLLSKSLKSLDIDAIRVVNADFDYVDGLSNKPLHRIKKLNLNVKDLLIDSLSQFDSTRFYYTKDISFEITGYQSKDKMYLRKIDTISGSAAKRNILIKGFKMTPLYPDLAFSRMHKYGKDRYDLDFDKISFTGVDFLLLNDERTFHAGKITLGPAKAGIFLNRELPAPPNLDKGKNFPHLALRRLAIPTLVDTLKIDNIDVAYTEYNPISQKRGTIYFQNLTGNVLNVTNDSLSVVKNNHAIANLTALVMKKSKINIKIDFSLTDPNGAFHYSGAVAPMHLPDLNVVSKPLGLIEIESGEMQKVDFDIQANRTGSKGKVHFYYTDLKVKLLKEGEDGAAPEKRGLLSFLANKLLIIDANPTKGEAPRTAHVTFERSPAASFFNLLWKGVFIGMRESAGLGIVPVKTPEKAMEAIKDKKEERKEKRAERQQKRAERKKNKT
ncbi:hypothetical protein H9X96_07150 [Pedobacter sp. N36a]|uniref:hypothetical protein n=1 Tax=Pedobacter sp. N36a TaxID=2767996 RepID=UPI001656C01D|nr:hypothetical protein [Pedobacter sp. N36a]MBC8985549.1 hypothetical protein [Pedobacter sp. N36a]